MFPLLFALFNLFFALIYYFNKDRFKNMKTFIDAMYYSFNIGTFLGYNDIIPTNRTAKIITMIQILTVFLSVSSFIFQPLSNLTGKLIFSVVNIGLIIGMAFVYKYTDPNMAKTLFDYTYFSTLTHTSVGLGDHKKPLHDNIKFVLMGHILLIFVLLYTYNNGFFSILKSSMI